MSEKMPLLDIQDLRVAVEGKEILKGVDLAIYPGEIHALMGPNGSGKSTLANTLLGHPKYQVLGGRVLFRGESILELPPHERARRGLFLAFQYPVAIPGVSLGDFLRSATKAVRGNGLSAIAFRRLVKQKMELLKMDPAFIQRYVNDGFSGGEKKRAEVLQMAVLEPHLAVLDETDSGLGIDALRTVAEGVNAIIEAHADMGTLVITHYQRLLDYIQPHFVHVLVAGRVVESGGRELVEVLEAQGYEPIIQRVQQDGLAAVGGR
ncbi:MAG: Fe-S cluster assembly ATPase SufC [Chloroflexi bacterium]|nr:Fe-S cluster assembly ATPase SufC [Chloroflexota bacterium]